MRSSFIIPIAAVLLCAFTTQASAAGPVVVSCGPGQHAIVHDGFAGGRAVTEVQCVGAAYNGAPYRTAYAAAPYRAAYSGVPYRTRYSGVRRTRSWGKTALMIGGSAGTGAGIGALVHGKKGALIGAALGGGAASLFESTRRR